MKNRFGRFQRLFKTCLIAKFIMLVALLLPAEVFGQSGTLLFTTIGHQGNTLADGDAGSSDIAGISYQIYGVDTGGNKVGNIYVESYSGKLVSHYFFVDDGGFMGLSYDKLVIESGGGEEFALKSFNVFDELNYAPDYDIRGFRNSSEVAYQYKNLSAGEDVQIDLSADFENIDRIEISNQAGSVNESFNNFAFDNPMASNQSPTDISLSSTSVSQSGGINATVGTLSTTDADGGDTHTYSLVAGTGDVDNGSFNINGNELRANDASSLEAGDFSVRIQTNDGNGGTHSEAFTITVFSSNANLTNLTLSEGTLAPPFEGNTLSYTTTVSYENLSVTVSPTLSDVNASVTVNGSTVTSGSSSNPVALDVGENTVNIIVTAEDGTTTKDYEVKVTRNHPFAGGEGTEADPYQIVTAEQLDNLRNFPDKHFIQTADIDLGVAPYNQGSGWEPLGDAESSFTGSFEGNGNSIFNLTINRSGENGIGLFGDVEGKLHGIAIINADVTGAGSVGILAGAVSGEVNQSYSTGSVAGDNNTGGLIGYLEFGSSLNSSYTLSDVTFNSVSGGGLAGVMQANNITNSYAVGNINGPDNRKGGLVGDYEEGNPNYPGDIINSFYNEDTSGQADDKGVSLSTSEMKTKSTFIDAGWDFDTVWKIDEASGGSISYPYLQNNTQAPAPGYEIINLPVASNVTISGSLTYDQELTGEYKFSDADGDTEGATTFQWYRSDDENGNDRSAIAGATTTTYTLTIDDIGKYISFEVIPNDGTYYGDAAETTFQGSVSSPFAGGEGTEADPYQIVTAGQLDYVRDFLDKHFEQTADIDLGVSPWNDGSGWEPIGTSLDPFAGNFDGGEFVISNMFINRPSDNYVGLFGYMNGTVSKIELKSVDITGGSRAGAVTATAQGGIISTSYSTGSVEGKNGVGGLVGYVRYGTTINNSYSTADVEGGQEIGGLVGIMQGDAINNSYSTGSVTASSSNLDGGFIGYLAAGSVSNSFWDIETSTYTTSPGRNDSGSPGGTGKGSQQMKTKSTFTDAGWDFDTVWQIDEASGGSISYPYLLNNTQNPAPGYEIINLPVASDITISGSLIYDQELTGEYNFSDADGDTEGATTFQWYRSDDENGNGRSVIDGATTTTYTLTIDDIGKYISFEVIPNDGTYYGDAAETTFQGSVSSPFAGGEGTEADPYQIATAGQLDYVRDFLDKYFEQTADIDLGVSPWNDGAGWEPIAQEHGKEFSGQFDGSGYSISNLTINNSTMDGVGLFGKNEGTILNITLENVDIEARGTVGALVANNWPAATIENSSSSGNIIADNTAGGLVGINQGSVQGTSASVSIEGTSSIGGLAGINGYNSAVIENSYASGNVTGSDPDASSLGGLVGSNRGSVIHTSYATGSVSGNSSIGGLVGNNRDNGALIEYAYSTGNVTADGDESLKYGVGGFVGSNRFDAQIKQTYTFSKVTGDTESGFAGNNDATITSSFWNTELSEQQNSDGGIGKSTSELISASTYTDAGWDFDSVWQIDEPSGGNVSYPYLQNNQQDPAPGYLDVSEPVVTTGVNLSNLSSGSVDVTGEVTDDGNLDVTQRGFVWAADDSPGDTTNVWSGSGTGSFNATINDLPPGTSLNVRSIAINRAGTSYGDPVSFETESEELSVDGSFTVQDKVYDGDWSAEFDQNSLSLKGIFDGHNVEIGDIEIEFSDADAGTGKQVTIQSVNLTGDDADKYTLSLANAPESDADITNRALTVEADPQTITYGDSDPALSWEITSGSLVKGDQMTGELERTGDQNTGSYTIKQGTLTAGDNYDITYQSADFEITQRTLTITADAEQAKIYGETDPAFTFEASNFGWSDDETLLTGSLDRTAGEDVGRYAIIGGDLDAGGNYVIDFTSADFAITPKELSILADSNQTKIYGEPDPAFTFTAGGFEFADDENIINGSLDRAAGEDAGTYAIGTGKLDAGSNYTISFTSADFEITPRPLTLTNFVAGDKTYDGSTDADGTGFDDDRLAGDDLAFDYDAVYADPDAASGKLVNFTNIAISGGDDKSNYDLQTTNGSATAEISQKAITLSADTQQVVYGDADPQLTYEITNGSLVAGEQLSGELSRVSGRDAGRYAIQQGSLTAGDNYDITYQSADFEITSKMLSIEADADQGKVYGKADPVLTYTADGFEFSDNENILTGSLDRTAGEAVGTYTIGPGDLSVNSNYSINYTGADFTISGKELVITANAGQSKIYGENDPAFTFMASGFESGDDKTILTGSLSREAGEDVGKYEVTLNNLSAGDNYSITFNTDSLEITPKTLTVTADPDQEKIYGQADPAFTFTADGFEFSDNESEFMGSLGRASGEDVGSYGITKGDLSAGENYSIDYSGADFVITPATLSVSADADQSKVYGEDDPDFAFTAAGFEFTDDDSEISGTLVRTTGEDVGTYTISAGDLDAGKNYTIDYTDADFEITTKTLDIVAEADQNKEYGESDPHLTYQADGFGFNDDESDITGAPEREAGEKAGRYTITKGSLDAGKNYTIDFTGADFTITAKELSVVASEDQEKTYGEADPEIFSYAVINFSQGDDESLLSGSLSRIPGEDAGSYKITEGDLSAGDNYSIDFISAEFVIHEAELLITAGSDQSKNYGDEDPDFEWSADGFQLDDDEQIVHGNIDRGEGESTGNYDLKKGTLDAGDNYVITFEPAVFGITPKTLVVSADEDLWKFEGDKDPDLTFTATGFAFDDDENLFKGALSREFGEQPGEYVLTAGNLSAGQNYDMEFESEIFSILRTPPVIVQRSPAAGESRIATDVPVILEFDHDITIADSELISLKGPKNSAIEYQAETDGNKLTLSHNGFNHHTTYTITLNAGGVRNEDGIGNEAAEWNFTTIMPAPLAENPSPADGDTHVDVEKPIEISFNQEVSEADFSGISVSSDEGISPAEFAFELEKNRLIISHSGLDHLTDYTVTIPENSVQNEDGVGNETYTWSFKTIIAVPEQVELTSPSNREGSVMLDASLEWNPSAHAETYHIQISGTETFDELLRNEDELTGLFIEPEELFSDYQTYFWRVRASNDAGNSDWSDVHRFTTLANTPGEIFPLKNSEEISTAPALEWDSDYETTYRVQLSDSENFVSLLSDTLTEHKTLQLTGLEADYSYYWRVRVESDETSSVWSEPVLFRTRPAPSTEDESQVVEQEIDFGDTSNREERVISELDYRMVGLPGSDHHGVEDFFEGKYGREWKVFYENGKMAEFYDEYEPGDDRFVFAPGRGFWVLSTEIVDLELKITSVKTNERDAYSIPLHPGWNIISNPHRGAVSWADVQELNNFSGDAWGYDQRFELADSLHPVQAYYIYNHPEQVIEQLDIPYAKMEQRRSEQLGNALMAANKQQIYPRMRLSTTFENSGRFDTEVLFPGLSRSDSGREVNKNEIRRFYPSLEMSRSGMMLVNEEHLSRGGLLREVAGYDEQGTEFELHLKGETGSRFHWKLNLEEMPDQTHALIVNRTNKQNWLLANGDEIESLLTEPNAVYDVIAGDEYWLEQLQQELIPHEFTLAPNYPNPFNPVTNIRYSLPEKQHVKLEIYDVLGRRVQVLKNDLQQPGWHVVQFDGSRLASGVYLYRLTTENDVRVRKMTLVK